jgi:hypothetical protein
VGAKQPYRVTHNKVLAQFHIDPEDWSKFADVSSSQNRSRSAQLRELVKRDIEEHDERLKEAA